MRRFLRESLNGRNLDQLAPAESASLYEATDAHIKKLYGVSGWDIAARANGSRIDQLAAPIRAAYAPQAARGLQY